MSSTQLKEFEKTYALSEDFRRFTDTFVKNMVERGGLEEVRHMCAVAKPLETDSSVKGNLLFFARRIALALPKEEQSKAQAFLTEAGVDLFNG